LVFTGHITVTGAVQVVWFLLENPFLFNIIKIGLAFDIVGGK
jgi:hypothetical protein